MVFSSPRFLTFLAVVLALLALPLGNERKKVVLAGASCFFYAAWDYRYLALLLTVGVVSYEAAIRIAAADTAAHKRLWLTLSTVVHLGLLGYFKYYNFFVENLNGVLSQVGVALPMLGILLPAGISFFTFKTLSYTIDVCRGEMAATHGRLDYITFVTFFPELIAGPIVRASVFLPQLGRTIGPSRERMRAGGSMFLLGVTKKLFIADRVAPVADAMFAAPEIYSTLSVWLGVLAYAIQIYCDFSGYSDMAIGTAKMIGYDLPENFAMPYLSRSITEFWRRWHMTLSFWLRDYLYIPLGGNRRGPARTYVNLLATMALGGLWHGASWNFVAWGTAHGAALAIHRMYDRFLGPRRRMPDVLALPVTLLFVVLCWVPFRAEDFATTLAIFHKLAGLGGPGAMFVSTPLVALACLVVAAHVVGARLEREPLDAGLAKVLLLVGAERLRSAVSGVYPLLGCRGTAGVLLAVVWGLTIFYFRPAGTTAFIYFRF